MNDWIKNFMAQAALAAGREYLHREVLVHYALMFEQQVLIGDLLTSKPDEFSDGILGEEIEKACLKASLLVCRLRQQGIGEIEAMVAATQIMLKHELEKQNEQH